MRVFSLLWTVVVYAAKVFSQQVHIVFDVELDTVLLAIIDTPSFFFNIITTIYSEKKIDDWLLNMKNSFT